MNKYTLVVGLEIHVELKTKSKMFCQCSADYFGKEPNTNTCPVCLGMPGALPVPNRTAIEWAIKIGQALNCKINNHSKFDRKHYFYPDLPKAYQISQYDEPFAVGGELVIASAAKQSNSKEIATSTTSPRNDKTFRITRVHLEEDTGKLTHEGDDSLVDFNRSSVPLVEIVTEPDFDNVEDIKAFLEELHTIIKYLDVSDANMEEGSMRIEPNISLMLVHPPSSGHPLPEGGPAHDLPFKGSTPPKAEGGMLRELPHYKVEVKNINSFNFAKKAIEYEMIRQAAILDKGETPTQETRGYNEDKKITYSQRSKEDAKDYRYFPEPDIPPIELTDKEIEDIRSTISELPAERRARYVQEYNLKASDAALLCRDIEISQYFEKVLAHIDKGFEVNVSNAIINKKISTDLSPEDFAKQLTEMAKPKEVDEDKLASVIASVLSSNPKQVESYKAGKTGLLQFFIGQVMKEMKGQADPQMLQKLIEEKLS
ncbi:MAG: Asp-tRNA(Asn)/Glu-tRNA(Gln) amidotransferase subunit GatB [bacterium]|nr:Asp-tRNA(Asn)/Glu-tRNA(Gln) amidotransferase subunit GatB [bacterium]